MDQIFLEKGLWDTNLSPEVSQLRDNFVNELPEKQREKINKLRVVTKDVLKAHHDDLFLNKWLKARKFDLTAAENMLRANLKWREENGIDRLCGEYKPPEVCIKYQPLGIFGYDKCGANVFIFPMGNMDIRGLVYSAKTADISKYYIVTLEVMDKLNIAQTKKLGKLVTCNIMISDMENFRLQDFIWRPAFDTCIAVVKALDANYPETVRKIFVINAPKVFSIFWTMVKPFVSEETKNKIFIHGKDGWQDDVFEAIDANQLPKHWGGNLVDEIDGNPYCSSKICMGGPIPESYFRTQSKRHTTNDKLLSVTVDRASFFKVELIVEKIGAIIKYTFETEENDIAFGITYKPQTNNGPGTKTHVLPVTRVNCHFVPEEGSLLCDKPGIYTLVFDNKYSWYKSKKLLYEVHVEPPEEL